MTDNDLVRVFTRVREELPPEIQPVGSASVREVGDKRRQKRVALLAVTGLAAAVAMISVAPQFADSLRGSAPPPTSTATGAEELKFTLPAGWAVLGAPDKRITCVGPRDTRSDAPCPVEIVVAPDPTVVSPRSTGITDVVDACGEGQAKRVKTVDPTRDLPVSVSIFKGGCGAMPPTTTVVALDTGAVFVRSQERNVQRELESLLSTFVIPRDWADEGDSAMQTEAPSASPGDGSAPGSGPSRHVDPSPGVPLALNDFPVTDQGLTYGSDAGASSAAEAPDLIAVVATNGRAGFVRRAVLWSNQGVTNPQEAAIYEERIANGWRPAPARVWDLEGNQIGYFRFSE